MNKLISIDDLTIDDINDIFELAGNFKENKDVKTLDINPVIGIMFLNHLQHKLFISNSYT